MSHPVGTETRLPLEGLRRFATELGQRAGLTPMDSRALANYLLWYDQAGASQFGIRCLPDWLETAGPAHRGTHASVRVGKELDSTAELHAAGGLVPVVLARAMGIAVEKAREGGLGLVRVVGAVAAPPVQAAAIVAEAAIGPSVALAVGPGPSWSIAVPTSEGLPVIHDTALHGRKRPNSIGDWGALSTWAGLLLSGPGDWLIGALRVDAFDAPDALRARVDAATHGPNVPGLLGPGVWRSRRERIVERGVPMTGEDHARLSSVAERHGVSLPDLGPHH